MNNTTELLLPAGSPEKLRYAIAYGADAVYFGLPMASLRTPSRGEQFTPQNIGDAIDYCHQNGVKAYITTNIFAANHDLKRLIPHLEQLEALCKVNRKPDAMILSDPGVFRLAKKYAPSIPKHISTQANTLNVEACAFWQDLGAERIILAREVPLREIQEIHEALPDLQLETFIHGSLCVAYSGRCVISDYLTDNTKNSNKGLCGNSCRWEFESADTDQTKSLHEVTCEHTNEDHTLNHSDEDAEPRHMDVKEISRPDQVYTLEEDEKGSYLLNSRDLCLIRHMRDLQEAGVTSFKVEGRTKSVYYVATTGRVYRQALAYYQAHPDVKHAPEELVTRWIGELSQAGNRGFTEGFLHGRPDNTAINYETSDSMQSSTFIGSLEDDGKQLWIKARNPFQVGDTVEWITPDNTVFFEITELLDKNGHPVKSLQTNQRGQIPNLPAALKQLPKEELLWSLLARPVKEPAKAHA